MPIHLHELSLELAKQVDLHADVVDGQHMLADAVLLEPFAVRAVELARTG